MEDMSREEFREYVYGTYSVNGGHLSPERVYELVNDVEPFEFVNRSNYEPYENECKSVYLN